MCTIYWKAPKNNYMKNKITQQVNPARQPTLPLSQEELQRLNAYSRAANKLSTGRFTCSDLNRVIREYDLNRVYISGYGAFTR